MTGLVFIADDCPIPASLEASWLDELSAGRREQLRGWADAGARRHSLIGTRLLRAGLMSMGHPADALLSLRYPAEGKPALDLPLDFSVSHCEGRVVCAISTSGPIGVDIERVDALSAADFRLYLGPRERAWAGDDPRRFYILWTRKEAVVKAAGRQGLRHLSEFEAIEPQVSFAGRDWYTVPLEAGPGYCAHLALSRPPTEPVQPERIALADIAQARKLRAPRHRAVS